MKFLKRAQKQMYGNRKKCLLPQGIKNCVKISVFLPLAPHKLNSTLARNTRFINSKIPSLYNNFSAKSSPTFRKQNPSIKSKRSLLELFISSCMLLATYVCTVYRLLNSIFNLRLYISYVYIVHIQCIWNFIYECKMVQIFSQYDSLQTELLTKYTTFIVIRWEK